MQTFILLLMRYQLFSENVKFRIHIEAVEKDLDRLVSDGIIESVIESVLNGRHLLFLLRNQMVLLAYVVITG